MHGNIVAFHMYASTIERVQRGLAIAGPGSSNNPTLTLGMLQRHASVLALHVREQVRVKACPKYVAPHNVARSMLASLPECQRQSGKVCSGDTPRRQYLDSMHYTGMLTA
jgi:hypothetical protein